MSMLHRVKDLSPDQRLAIETLLGHPLSENERVTILSSRITKDSPAGEERSRLYEQYLNHVDRLADRVKDVPEVELDAAIEEATDYVRHNPK